MRCAGKCSMHLHPSRLHDELTPMLIFMLYSHYEDDITFVVE